MAGILPPYLPEKSMVWEDIYKSSEVMLPSSSMRTSSFFSCSVSGENSSMASRRPNGLGAQLRGTGRTPNEKWVVIDAGANSKQPEDHSFTRRSPKVTHD